MNIKADIGKSSNEITITSIRLSFGEIFALTFRVVLALALMAGAVATVIYIARTI
jgi:hypothetical protein